MDMEYGRVVYMGVAGAADDHIIIRRNYIPTMGGEEIMNRWGVRNASSDFVGEEKRDEEYNCD